jgi:hypothetical protein
VTSIKLDAETLAFLESGVSIKLSSANAERVPSVGRCKGCRVEGGVLRVFVSATQDADVVNDVRASGRISVAFCRPSTHRTLQLKGNDVRVEPLVAADRQAIAQHLELFAAELAPLGFSAEFTHAYLGHEDADDVALVFSPSAIYKQTPGPDAGEPYFTP